MLNRFFLLPLFCLSLLALSCPALAKEMKFAHFSMDVPAACTVQEREGKVTVRATPEIFFTIAVFTRGEAGNLSDKDFAARLAQQLKGSAPIATEDGGWSFTAKAGTVAANVDVIGDADYVMMFMSDAGDKEWPEALQAAYDSIKGNNAKVDDFLQKTLFAE
ncbi:hypothetical protein [Desulfovibrio sp.]|uniref:hypothetical protein n=1 Tax=Desulfovibrio sp. TaxID=885 RepID=UPI0025BD3C1E|nr:hypothetical protein [Desulfovibrio sp.]